MSLFVSTCCDGSGKSIVSVVSMLAGRLSRGDTGTGKSVSDGLVVTICDGGVNIEFSWFVAVLFDLFSY